MVKLIFAWINSFEGQGALYLTANPVTTDPPKWHSGTLAQVDQPPLRTRTTTSPLLM